MRTFILGFLAFASGGAYATCQSVYNPMSGNWDYVCTPQPSDPRPPQCHQEYDPMNQVWVTVCN